MKVYLIRHGQTTHNREGRWQGWFDSKLTELGRKQAEELGERLADIDFDLIYSSPLSRALDTAEIAMDDIIQLDELMEMDLGDYQEKLVSETIDKIEALINNPSTKPHGGESIGEFVVRTLKVMDLLEQHYEDGNENIALFTHGGVIRMILTKHLKLIDRARFGNGEYVVIERDKEGWRLI